MDFSKLDRIANEALDWPSRARALGELLTPAHVQTATEYLLAIRDLQKKVEDEIGPMVQSAHATHKRTVEFRKAAEEPLKEAEVFIKNILADYSELEHRRLLTRESERESEVKKLAAARADAGDPIETLPVVYEEPTSVVQGISTRQNFKAEVTDMKAFLLAMVETLDDDAFRRLVKINQRILNEVADNLGPGVQLPGLTVTAHRVVTFKPSRVRQEETWEV
jgi:di/tripeptidase